MTYEELTSRMTDVAAYPTLNDYETYIEPVYQTHFLFVQHPDIAKDLAAFVVETHGVILFKAMFHDAMFYDRLQTQKKQMQKSVEDVERLMDNPDLRKRLSISDDMLHDAKRDMSVMLSDIEDELGLLMDDGMRDLCEQILNHYNHDKEK